MNYWFLLIPVISAFIGWLVNSSMIRLLFHPRKQKNILGIRIQGLIPKRQKQIAESIGQFAGREFLSFRELESKISSKENLEKIMPSIEAHIDDFLRHRLGKEMPMISMFIGDKTITKMKEALMKEIETLFPAVMKQYAANLQHDLNLGKVVADKLSSISIDQLEVLMHQHLNRELRLFSLLGAATGFLIGLVQVLITLLYP